MALIHNLKLHRRVLLRAAAGAALVLLASLGTVFIRDALSQRSPEDTLPVMDVYYNGIEAGDRLPAANIKRDKYIWQFLLWTRQGGGLDLEIWREIPPAYVNPGAHLDLEFSFAPKEIRVYMAFGENPFAEVGSQLIAPSVAGTYTYRVEAVWGAYKLVQYYFRVRIPNWAS